MASSVWTIPAITLGILGASCSDPEGAFNEFVDRQEDLAQGGSGGMGGTGGTGGAGGAAGASGEGGAAGGGCTPLEQSDVAEGYLFTLSAIILPKKPFIADATVTMDEANNTISMSVQPLNADDRTTPEGAPILGGPFQIQEDGSFVADFGEITMDGKANPISGSDLQTTLVLTAEPGGWCKESTFVCGAAQGQATKPLTLNLEGSTFTFQRLDGSGYPDPILDCALNTP